MSETISDNAVLRAALAAAEARAAIVGHELTQSREIFSQPFSKAREQFRSLTERVHRDPGLHMLDGDPPTQTVLQSVERADLIKSGRKAERSQFELD